MSLSKSTLSFGIFGAVIAAGFLVWFFMSGKSGNKMLEEVDDKLVRHELSWAGRGKDYAQYQITLWGEDSTSYIVTYRIPASVGRVPGLVVLHTIDSAKEVFELMNRVENASDCAILAINAGQYLKRDGSGKILMGDKDLESGLVSGLRAVDLAIEFLRGHSIVDTSAVYLLGIGEASLLALPAAANHQEILKGVACINPEAMMNLKSWGKSDFASPIGWVGKTGTLQALLVMKGVGKSEFGLYNAFPATVNRMNAESLNEIEDIMTVIQWIWKDRPRGDTPEFKPGKPTKDKTAVFRK
jgi:hypothetical protein